MARSEDGKGMQSSRSVSAICPESNHADVSKKALTHFSLTVCISQSSFHAFRKPSIASASLALQRRSTPAIENSTFLVSRG
jgi:hypothetical protein